MNGICFQNNIFDLFLKSYNISLILNSDGIYICMDGSMKYPHKKIPRSQIVSACSSLRWPWDFNSRPGGSCEVLVSVSESGYPFFRKEFSCGEFFCGDISCGDLFCGDISGHRLVHTTILRGTDNRIKEHLKKLYGHLW